MLCSIELRTLAFLAISIALGTTASGQEHVGNADRATRFDAARAKMGEIAKAIQEQVKRFRAAEGQRGGWPHPVIDAFREEIQELYDDLDKPRQELDKLRDEIQTQYDQAMQQYQQGMDGYTKVTDAFQDAMEMYQEAMEASDDKIGNNGGADESGTTDATEAGESGDEIEPLPDSIDVQPGATVVVLRHAELKVGKKVTGRVRKGESLKVGQVQEKWVSVRSGATSGWISRSCVISTALADWYQQHADNFSTQQGEPTRAKFEGVLFEIRNAGSGPSYNSFEGSQITFNDLPVRGDFYGIAYGRVGILLRGKGVQRELAIHLVAGPPLGGPFGGIFEVAQKARTYGTVARGDFVTIDTAKRQVFVNGERRQPQ